MGRQGHSAHIRTLHRNSAQKRSPALVDRSDVVVSDKHANGPACSRLGRSARVIFDVSIKVRGMKEIAAFSRAPKPYSAPGIHKRAEIRSDLKGKIKRGDRGARIIGGKIWNYRLKRRWLSPWRQVSSCLSYALSPSGSEGGPTGPKLVRSYE